jgi:hypothetical protein
VRRLVAEDPTGANWLLPLMELGSRAKICRPPPQPGTLRSSPRFEYPCLAAEDLLIWLIENAPLLGQSALGKFKGAPVTKNKRDALLKGDPVVRKEARARLASHGRRPGRGQWQVLEGETKVDCALFADNVTLFIEGKRTEPHLTDRVTWVPDRNQVLRNLDCLRVEAFRPAERYVLLVVEEGTKLVGEAIALDGGGATVDRALPHLADGPRQDLWSHYLGYTTWQAIQGRFQLDALPDTTADLEAI